MKNSVKLFRKNAGLSRIQLSLTSGISFSYLGLIEEGHLPSQEIQTKLANALNVKVNDIFHSDDDAAYGG